MIKNIIKFFFDMDMPMISGIRTGLFIGILVIVIAFVTR